MTFQTKLLVPSLKVHSHLKILYLSSNDIKYPFAYIDYFWFMTQRTLCEVEIREIDYFEPVFNICIILIIWNDKCDVFT